MGQKRIRIDLVGRVFTYLKVLAFEGTDRWGSARWRCVCTRDGNEVVVLGNSLLREVTKSCGCLVKQQKGVLSPSYKHGNAAVGHRTPEYECWVKIRQRCVDKKNKDYPDYGGRGIAVCDRWKTSFENFLHDIGTRPSPKHSLDRYPNNDGNYEPGNCRWATASEQAKNRRPRTCPHCGKILWLNNKTTVSPNLPPG